MSAGLKREERLNIYVVFEQGNNMNEELTITDAARIMGISRQALYVAIKNMRLKADKKGCQWFITEEQLSEYRNSRYSRKSSRKLNGDLLYDPEKNEFSIGQVAKMAEVPTQRIYYLVRTNQLKSTRVGAAHVIHLEDISSIKTLINSLHQ